MALVTTDFNINITPDAMPPVVHVSEYDIGRSYTVGLIGENNDTFTIPTGTTATIEGTLNGVVGFSVPATISNNKVAFTLTESMTAYAGKAWCKIKLTLNDEPIQTCAFILAVDRAGVEADTVIGADGFQEQINQAVADYIEDSGLIIDSTLSRQGAAADAAKVGEELRLLSEENVKSAELDEDNMVSFKNANGIVLFTLDLSELGTPASYGNLVLSAESLTVEEGGEGTFTVALDSAPSANQIVYLAVSDNTRLTVSPVTLTFTPENYAEPQTITVTSMQDDDKDDDTITVTLTSKKVVGKQLAVKVSDNYYVPQLATNGLILYADYTTWDGASDTLVDSAGGLSLTGLTAGFEKVTNGVKARSDVSYTYVYVTRRDDAYAAFQEAYNANREWTFEWFGNYFMANFYFSKIGSTGGTGFNSYLSDITSSRGSGTLASNMVGYFNVHRSYLDSSGIYKREPFIYDWDKFDGRIEYFNDFIHLVVTAGSNGEMKVYHNGSLVVVNTVEDFGSWPTMDTNGEYFNYINALIGTGNGSTAQSDGAWVSSQRIYNRVLTQEEIISNMKAEARRLGLSTFQ